MSPLLLLDTKLLNCKGQKDVLLSRSLDSGHHDWYYKTGQAGANQAANFNRYISATQSLNIHILFKCICPLQRTYLLCKVHTMSGSITRPQLGHAHSLKGLVKNVLWWENPKATKGDQEGTGLNLPWHLPLLHLTVGLAAVVDEARLIAHSVAVDHHAAIQVQTVLATVGEVLLHHTAPKIWWERK